MYATVSFDVKPRSPRCSSRRRRVLFDARGTRAAVVADGIIHWTPVVVEGDLGDKLAIASGLTEGSLVVAAPGDRLVEGMKVRVEDQSTSPAREAPPPNGVRHE